MSDVLVLLPNFQHKQRMEIFEIREHTSTVNCQVTMFQELQPNAAAMQALIN
jgi:hypothetical protein